MRAAKKPGFWEKPGFSQRVRDKMPELDRKVNEIFAGKVVALGAAHGIPTPVNQTVLRIIHVLEHQAGITAV